MQKIHYLLVVGAKESETGSVTIRQLGVEKQETKAFAEALARSNKLPTTHLTLQRRITLRRPFEMPKRPDKGDGTRINQDIRAREVRVIGSEGELLGVMPPIKALELAREEGLDLVEISPNAEPPVCKILDYGKYRYEQQKKASEARKKQKTVDIKEILLRPNIDDHDFETKMKAAKRFLKTATR